MTPIDIALLVATTAVLLVGAWAVTGAIALLRTIDGRGRAEILATAALGCTVILVAGGAVA